MGEINWVGGGEVRVIFLRVLFKSKGEILN